MTELPESMKKLYEQARELIENNDDIKIYTHIDCDGLCSGAILSEILDRLGKEHEIQWVNLDELQDLEIKNQLTIFSDLGSGQPVDKNANENQSIIILDHHPPLRDLDYNANCNYLEINPIHHGIDGSYYVCGGGLCYFLGKEFGYEDLSWIGVLSAIGDMQNSRTGKLEGLNTTIVNDAKKNGLLEIEENDLNLYGRKTNPLFVSLSRFSDVKLPITNNQGRAKKILKDLEIDGTVPLSKVTYEEKGKIFQELFKEIMEIVPSKYIPFVPKLLMSDSYEFLNENKEEFLSDASEFSTSMNACGRNEEYETAHKVLKGNRQEALDSLEGISKEHKRNLAKSIERVAKRTDEEIDEGGIIELDNIQYFDGYGIPANIVGTVTGMILGEGNWKKPMIGLSQTDEDNIKVSLRCSKLLSYDEKAHFGHIIREISQSVGGNGGGHAVACGAYIPVDKRNEFIENFNQRLEGIIEK
ncbi:MAG: DHH family phosphoesterase [Methanobrevibacter sp.]|nr:DHH family phosphoesterase [Methanobrevibacter sp.]